MLASFIVPLACPFMYKWQWTLYCFKILALLTMCHLLFCHHSCFAVHWLRLPKLLHRSSSPSGRFGWRYDWPSPTVYPDMETKPHICVLRCWCQSICLRQCCVFCTTKRRTSIFGALAVWGKLWGKFFLFCLCVQCRGTCEESALLRGRLAFVTGLSDFSLYLLSKAMIIF